MSASMNLVVMIGRLTKDPVQRGDGYAFFSIAVDRSFKRPGKAETDFFDVIVFNKNTAAYVLKYAAKGTLVTVTGSIELDTNTDADGVRYMSLTIRANDVKILVNPGNRTGGNEPPQQGPLERESTLNMEEPVRDPDVPEDIPAPAVPPGSIPNEWTQAGDEDLPF